jgi:hypothetical protein
MKWVKSRIFACVVLTLLVPISDANAQRLRGRLQARFGQLENRPVCPLLSGILDHLHHRDRQRPIPTPQPPLAPRPTTTLEVTGATVMKLPDENAGLPIATLPGVKLITYEDWSKMPEVPNTGLFLVETRFVPQGLPSHLEKEGLTLHENGDLLDGNKNRVTLFVNSEIYSVVPTVAAVKYGPESREILASALSGDSLALADPFPFNHLSWSLYMRYDGGFCRGYHAYIIAESFGPGSPSLRPHTRIQYMETRVAIDLGGTSDRDSGSNVDFMQSNADREIGCWWPAHGQSTGSYFANWKDGRIDIRKAWSWGK